MSSSKDYAAALAELEQLRAGGRISPADYDLHRARLLAEASAPARPLAGRAMQAAAIVILMLLLIGVLIWMFAS